MYIKIVFTAVTFALIIPQTSLARHDARVDRSGLDEDIVERISLPVLFGVDYRTVVPDFGDMRGGGTRLHVGQDMRAPKGTPIVSPTKAVVLSTGTGPSAGKYVYTANPGGESYRYMHLDEIANIKPGDTLSIGDFIGTVGDTGNAPEGIYHLHFEIRGSDGDFVDPYERFGDEFTTKEKMSFLSGILRDVDDEDEYAEFLVDTFPADFLAAQEDDIAVPDEIEDAMDDSAVMAQGDVLNEIKELLSVVPVIVTSDVSVGDDGPLVQLVQLFIIFHSEGAARNTLAAAGATGYYGGITQAAILEYQAEQSIPETGVYDSKTRSEMSK